MIPIIVHPKHGTRRMFEIENKAELKPYGRKVGDQFNGEPFDEMFAGCILDTIGGDDGLGFPISRKIFNAKQSTSSIKERGCWIQVQKKKKFKKNKCTWWVCIRNCQYTFFKSSWSRRPAI